MSMKRRLAAGALTALVGGGALIGLAPGAGAYELDDWCGSVPLKFPFPQPDPDPWPFRIVFDRGELVNPVDIGHMGVGAPDLGADLGAQLGGIGIGR
jgi:hypothetical protein